MIVLSAQYKKYLCRAGSLEAAQVPFFVLAQVIICSDCICMTCVAGKRIDHLGENIFGIIHTHRKYGSFIDTDVGFIVLGKLAAATKDCPFQINIDRHTWEKDSIVHRLVA